MLSVAVDIWSAGCIMAEMLLGKPLFKGNDRILIRNTFVISLHERKKPTPFYIFYLADNVSDSGCTLKLRNEIL